MLIDGRTLSHEVSEAMRLMAVRRVHEGEEPSVVIKTLGMCRTTIYKWLRIKKQGGEKALKARSILAPRASFRKRKNARCVAGSADEIRVSMDLILGYGRAR